MKSILSLFIFSIFSYSIVAQNVTDVVRWSTLDPVGTARTLGVGSSFGAMGGDFSVININPAGIADFRLSEFTITPSLRSNKTNSFFVSDKNENISTKASKLGLDNIGFVIASNPGTKWTTSNFAIGFSRVADHRKNVSLSGVTPGSITSYFKLKADGIKLDDLDDFVAYPAVQTGAIFDGNEDLDYSTDFEDPKVPLLKKQEIIQSGGINELAFGWAGEYKNNLSLGLSIGVPFASFNDEKIYTELDPNDEIPFFNNLEYTENLNTTGVGFNFKAGFKYKIKNRIRLGGAFHSPTWFSFTDDFNNSLTYSFTESGMVTTNTSTPVDGTFDYNITTPWRAIGSIGTTYSLGELKGFINADIEYLDYTESSYTGKGNNESAYNREVNRTIQTKLGTSTNVRLGTELAYKSIRVRLGYAWEQPAFNAETFYNDRLSYGFGYREDNFFIDLGFRRYEFLEGYNPYIIDDNTLNPDGDLDPLANINNIRTRAALTLGFKF